MAGRHGAGKISGELCLPVDPDGIDLVRQAEGALLWREEAEACREWQEEAEGTIAASDNLVRAQAGRIVELEREGEDARRQARENLEAGRQAVKAAAGPWYRQAISAMKWIAGSLVLGYVLGRTGR